MFRVLEMGYTLVCPVPVWHVSDEEKGPVPSPTVYVVLKKRVKYIINSVRVT